MKAFLVGLIFLVGIIVLAGIGILLFYPFLILAALSLRILAGILIVVFFIWLLGKVIIFAWKKLNPPKDKT
jgi:hypothetical protein